MAVGNFTHQPGFWAQLLLCESLAECASLLCESLAECASQAGALWHGFISGSISC